MTDIVRDPYGNPLRQDAEIARLRAEVSELNELFDARWSADMRAIECWRKVNPGNELVLPDHVDLSLWLMEERTRLTAEVEQNKIDFEEYRRDVEKLRAALRQIAGIDVWDNSEQGYVDKARAALEGK